MTLSYIQVTTPEQIKTLADLAGIIWNEYWPARIGQDQTDYMVEKFQSEKVLTHDILEKGYLYYFLQNENDKYVGYIGVLPEYFEGKTDDPQSYKHGLKVNKTFENRLFVSKIYLLKEERGKHYSSMALEFLEQLLGELNLDGMYLTVNRENDIAIRAYIGNGFEVIDEVDADIGEGFVMNDHIMARKKLTS